VSPSRLTAQQIQQYQNDGYTLFNQPVFAPAKFERLTGLFEEMLANRESGLRFDELDTPHFREPRLFEFLFADEVLDLVEPVIGPNIGLWSSHFIAKEPFTGRATPWHEDSAYWNGRFDRLDKIVTVWLALDRSDRGNGCMRVIPGTQRGGFSDYEAVSGETNTFNSAIRADQIDESRAVYFELDPNECSLHDGRIIHGAEANTSPRRRAGYTMRYFGLDMVLNRQHPGNQTHRLWHCRGENVGNNPLEPNPIR
jgi:ectoine hydroxylase-related dioxygenase (phytanoyl-CoA dioxygenase family)